MAGTRPDLTRPPWRPSFLSVSARPLLARSVLVERSSFRRQERPGVHFDEHAAAQGPREERTPRPGRADGSAGGDGSPARGEYGASEGRKARGRRRGTRWACSNAQPLGGGGRRRRTGLGRRSGRAVGTAPTARVVRLLLDTGVLGQI